MKDKKLMISIQFSHRARGYMSWINPKIYDINILSSCKCGTTEWSRERGWTGSVMQEARLPLLILWHLYQLKLQMENTDGL